MTATMHTVDLLTDAGLIVHDLRHDLPTHAAKRYRRRKMDEVRGVCIHHNAGSARGKATAFADAGYHVSKRGWPGIAYFAQIGPHGEVYICNDIEACGYAQGTRARPGDENREFVAIAVQGAFASRWHDDLGEPEVVQIASKLTMWAVLRDMLGLDDVDLRGHFDLGKPSCPGATLEGVIRSVRHEND